MNKIYVVMLAVASMLLSMSTAHAAIDAYLTMDGIQGPVTFTNPSGGGETNAIHIEDFSFGASQATNGGSAGSGAGAGKINFNPFTVKKLIDAASPLLFQACVTGQHSQSATIDVYRSDTHGSLSLFYRIQLTDVFVSSFDQSLSTAGASRDGDDGPKESIALVYGAISLRIATGP